jgi:hypothetical protein
MTKIQIPKQVALGLIWELDIEFWNIFVIWCLQFAIFSLPGLDICSPNFDIDNHHSRVTFSERSLGKSSVLEFTNIITFSVNHWSIPAFP